MDPVGVTLGSVSLLFQVFSGCVQVYQLLSEARDFDKEYQFVRVRFKTEQYRLLDFATVAQLSENDDTLLITASNRDILLRVLDEQSRMMMRFGLLDDRLRKLEKPLIREEISDPGIVSDGKGAKDDSLGSRFPQNNTLLNKSLAFVKATSKYPSKLRWAMCDKEKVEELLSRLVASNNFLQELLNSHQLQQLSLQEKHTGYQIVQLNNKIDQLHEIIQAGRLSAGNTVNVNHFSVNMAKGMLSPASQRSPGTHGSVPENSTFMPNLVELSQFKALASVVDNDGLTTAFRASVGLETSTSSNLPLQLQESDVTLDPQDSSDSESRRATGWYHIPNASRRRVWIEWKRMEPQHIYDASAGPDPAVLRRFRALVTLLREHDQVSQFRAPPCLGYYLSSSCQTGGIRYGLLFQNPPGVDPLAPPRSLRQLLDGSDDPTPSLSARIHLLQSLVQAVEKLHAVNWLHKGLCSANVVFFPSSSDEDKDAGPRDPYLTGFDYARPGGAASLSSAPAASAAEDLYRHPGVQGGPREGGGQGQGRGLGFRKRHDIYSLGVVLVEIARWKPVESVLGIQERGKVRVRDVIGARDKLLSVAQREELRAAVGDAAAGAIAACLVGVTALGLAEGDSEVEGAVAARLQIGFYEAVVRPLMDIKI